MKFKKSILTIGVRKIIYESTVDRSLLWHDMTLAELKNEWLAMGNTPALCTEMKDAAIRYLYLAQMKRMIG